MQRPVTTWSRLPELQWGWGSLGRVKRGCGHDMAEPGGTMQHDLLKRSERKPFWWLSRRRLADMPWLAMASERMQELRAPRTAGLRTVWFSQVGNGGTACHFSGSSTPAGVLPLHVHHCASACAGSSCICNILRFHSARLFAKELFAKHRCEVAEAIRTPVPEE